MTEQLTQRQRRRTMTDKMVAALPRKRKRYTVSDVEQRGLYIRVPPSGPSTFAVVARGPGGRQVWHTVGGADVLKIEEAREKAREAIKRIKVGLPAVEAPPVRPDSFQTVAENWLKRHVVANKLRSGKEIERVLRKYIFPHLESRPFAGIRRSDVAKLLDHIEDQHGARQADVALSIIRGISNWHATRHDDYVSPVARGMRRDKAAPRDRILEDDELRAVWNAAETAGSFGALVRVLLLTAQRRGAVLGMQWSDVSLDGVWTIRAEARAKGTAGALQLPAQVLAAIAAQPRFSGVPYVFAASRGDGPLRNLRRAKERFDQRCGVTGWTLHDLRRTARSLMARAGVRPDIAERVLGHAIVGVEGIYDRYAYHEEKADALLRLAVLVETIVNPPEGDVVPLRTAVVPS